MMLSDVAQQIAATVIGEDVHFNHVSTDTRTINLGDLFIALRGEKFDGHKFISAAIEKGACGVVVDTPMHNLKIPQLIVADTVKALGKIAAVKRQQFSGSVISLTGSCGKTTVKDMLQAICRRAGRTAATKGNLNNHIGVPLTLLALENNEKTAIIEAGTSGLGEIAYLADIIRPDIALVNNIYAAHLQGLKDEQTIAEEKADLYRFLAENGTAIINLDCNYAEQFLQITAKKRQIGFSFSDENPALGLDCDQWIKGFWEESTRSLCMQIGEQQISVRLQLLGEANISNALAAAACAYAAGCDLADIVQGLESFTGVKGRLKQVESNVVKTLIDDTYNANPGSVKAALLLLAKQKNSIFIFGDMGELGEKTVAEHAEVGKTASRLHIARVYCIGENSKEVIKHFNGKGKWFSNQQTLIAALEKEDLSDSTVLVKGSRYMKMENVVNALVQSGVKHNAGLAS